MGLRSCERRMLVGRPVLSGIRSTICPLPSSKTTMESGYAPRKSVAADATPGRSIDTSTARNVFIGDYGKTISRLRQSLVAAAHLPAQPGELLRCSGTCAGQKQVT